MTQHVISLRRQRVQSVLRNVVQVRLERQSEDHQMDESSSEGEDGQVRQQLPPGNHSVLL